MPKMFVHARAGVLTTETRARIARELTDLGIACERLSGAPEVRRGVWIFFAEHGADSLFQGGEVATDPIAGVIVYALEGGLDDASRRQLIAGATSILGAHIVPDGGPAPVYVAIRDVPEANWGMFGNQVSLSSLRAAR